MLLSAEALRLLLGRAERHVNGAGNEFESEALPGALPQGQNNPQARFL